MGRIGILGGTFDPIHYGHIRFAIEAYEQLKLDHIRFIPCYLPSHRKNPEADFNARAAMVHRAIENIAHFLLDDCEMKRGSVSYTIDTLRSLHQDHPAWSLYLLIGSDVLHGLSSWHQHEQLLSYANIVVVKRTAKHQNAYTPAWMEHYVTCEKELFLQTRTGMIYWLEDAPWLDISSSFIRERLLHNRSVNGLVPPSIKEHLSIYRG